MRLRHPFFAALVAALAAAGPAATARAADGLAGPYLAGRLASIAADYAEAADYFGRALIADPSNPPLLESAVIARIALGQVDRTAPMVTQLDALKVPSQAANMVTFATLAQGGDYAKALAELDAGRSAGSLVDGLYRAWALVGEGRMSDALTEFDTVAATEGLSAFGLYHKALALASVGDFEGADAILSGKEGPAFRPTRRGVIAHAEVLSQLERNDDAIAVIRDAFGATDDPGIAAIVAALEAGQVLPFTVVTGPADGVAEVFFTVAGALSGENADAYTLAYARLAAFVRPGHVDALLLSANLLERQRQFDLAVQVYDLIPRGDPASHVAEIGRANAMVQADRIDAAVEVLTQLAKANPDLAVVWTSLGDTLRRQERYADAAAAYDSAIGTFAGDAPDQWPTYYARGISFERQKMWDRAEADFRRALALSPDQPQVLNYLGYGLLERKEKLEEALGMIERAVAARPEDGYIVDSLGWGLYLLGRYPEAVSQMERAVELMPIDPVVNDHLGDVYWAVGRKLEAEFQWKRALSFDPEEKEITRIRRKLEVGLDVVLQEEGATPPAVAENGN